jgi:hypothetical protein
MISPIGIHLVITISQDTIDACLKIGILVCICLFAIKGMRIIKEHGDA